MARSSKYVGPEGEHLVVHEDNTGLLRIAWAYPEDGIGSHVGEIEVSSLQGEEDKVALLAHQGVASLNPEKDINGFFFEKMSAANLALKAANARILHYQENKPWPEWATTAAAAGWTPPKNWKP